MLDPEQGFSTTTLLTLGTRSGSVAGAALCVVGGYLVGGPLDASSHYSHPIPTCKDENVSRPQHPELATIVLERDAPNK